MLGHVGDQCVVGFVSRQLEFAKSPVPSSQDVLWPYLQERQKVPDLGLAERLFTIVAIAELEAVLLK
jgi:hypothetical protein